MIEIYTDGAYNPVTGGGGWAAAIIEDGQERLVSGKADKATSNRMEITAALEGLARMPSGAEITVYTDSQYLYGTMSRGWQRRANTDLWQKLDAEAAQRKVRWEWIDQNIDNRYQKEVHDLAASLVTAGVKPERASAAEPKETRPVKLTHLDEAGRPNMVDVTAKADTEREAIARCRIRMRPATFQLIKEGKVAKGDTLTTAQLAGIMGAKQTPHLIPLCHPILISNARVEFKMDEAKSEVEITAAVKSTGKTGVEMEALTAAGVAALTIYDMCKAVDRAMVIDNLRLMRKSGGKSGTIQLEEWD